MLGMANPNRSFIHVFKGKNFMMLIAFIVGFILQLIVINTPVVTDIFKTTFLELNEWLIVGVVSLIPLITHEIIVFIKWLRNQTNK